ncbi:MAG TPA: beta galactosidase jelly roll domain-containing protein, partial [Armatimonadota bacterium]
MNSFTSRLPKMWALLAIMGLIAILGGQSLAAEVVDLRGYGKVQASITPQRSLFTCENADKADILLGKLLADLFWDAGKDHVATPVKLGTRDALLHQWPPYGALIAGRNRRQVLVIGGSDAQDVLARARKEPLLTSADAVFVPVKPYPLYLDYYDLRAMKCGTMGLHPENKYRYPERIAFTQQFFPGGYFNGDFAFFGRTPAEGIDPSLSLLDADVHLAEQARQMYSISISTGEWPGWAQDTWPAYLDRQSPRHLLSLALSCPPESLGLSAAQRRQSSLHFLHDVMRRYTESPAMGGWELYCGDYVCETYFSKGYQGHLGYSAVGLDAFRRWLRDVRGYSLADLGLRWYGDAKHFTEWNDVTLPDPDDFFGNLNIACFPIVEGWSWKKAEAGQFERPADDAPGWTPASLPPSQQMLTVPAGPAFWRTAFDATRWLQTNAGKDVYLVCNVDNAGWRATNVWLNGTNLGEYRSKVNPFSGPFALKVTTLLHPGANQVVYQVYGGSGTIPGPVFLTTTRPQAYPYLGKQGNARYVDMYEWRLAALNFKVTDTMAYARSIDPDHPFVICSSSSEVKAGQSDALRQYGGSMQDTGYEASYRPTNSRLGYAGGFYGSAERSGIHDIKDAAGFDV